MTFRGGGGTGGSSSTLRFDRPRGLTVCGVADSTQSQPSSYIVVAFVAWSAVGPHQYVSDAGKAANVPCSLLVEQIGYQRTVVNDRRRHDYVP